MCILAIAWVCLLFSRNVASIRMVVLLNQSLI